MNCKVCGKTSAKNTSVSFFRFPKENTKCRKWAERCDLLGLYEKHGTLRFYKSFRICSDHFDSKDIIFDGRKKRLLQSAVPQITNKPIVEEKTENPKDFNQNEAFKLKLMENLCRLCGTENRNLTDIYGIRGRVLNLENKLKYFPLVINKYDVLPLRVCQQCISKVNQFHDFILNCLKAESKLKLMLNLESCEMSLTPEREENVVWDPEIHKTPNLYSPNKDLTNFLTCFPDNVEDNCDKVVQESFLDKESGCLYKQPQPDFTETNQLINHTNFIKDVDFRSRISLQHSNSILRDQLLSGSEIQTDTDQNFLDETTNCCDPCLESFCSGEVLKAHSYTIKSDLGRDLVCEICNKVFYSWMEFEEHNSKHENSTCRICDKKFQKFVFLKKHPLLRQLENSCECFSDLRPSKTISESDEKTSKPFTRRDETSLFHDIIKKDTKLEKLSFKSSKRRCQFCDKFFNNPQLCLAHEGTHTGKTPYECKLCEKTFRSRPSLRQHRSVHSDKRAHNCHECGMSFKRKDTLSNHLRIHTGERPFVCKICGFAFKQRGDCIKHEKNHQKVSPPDETDGSFWSQTQISDIPLVGFSTEDFPMEDPEAADGAFWIDKKTLNLTPYVTVTEENASGEPPEDSPPGKGTPFTF